jgi:hypothetical protein
VDLREITGTPPGAADQAFVFQCSTAPSFTIGDLSMHWVSAATLTETKVIALSGMIWHGALVLRGDKAFAYFPSTDNSTLLSNTGALSALLPSPWPSFVWRGDVSPDGRDLLWLVGDQSDEYAVLDTTSGAVRFRTKEHGAYYLVHETAGHVIQLVGSACPQPAPCSPEIMVLNAATGQVAHIPIPGGVGYVVPRAYGDRQVIVDTKSPAPGQPEGVAIVDLDSLKVVWSGPIPDASPSHTPMCGPLPFEGESHDLRLPLHVSFGGEGFVLQAPPRQAPTRCAITGDGRRLMVVAPPFLHFYAIDGL